MPKPAPSTSRFRRRSWIGAAGRGKRTRPCTPPAPCGNTPRPSDRPRRARSPTRVPRLRSRATRSYKPRAQDAPCEHADSERSRRRAEVCPGEVVALEQQGQVTFLGQRIGEAVAKVQAGGVVAPAEASVGIAGDQCLCAGHRLQSDPALIDEGVEQIALGDAPPAFDQDRSFKEVGDAQEGGSARLDQLSETLCFRFKEYD